MDFYKKLFLGCAVIIILAVTLWLSIGVYFSGDTAERKVLLIALDGATWDVISPMIERGYLPNMQRLMQEGSYGILRSEAPTRSPAIWTTLVTGKTRKEHGIYDFIVHLGEGAGGSVPVTSNIRRVKALWNIFTEKGLSVGVVGWWATWPAEEVDGFIISDRAFYKGLRNTTFPPVLKDQLVSLPKVKTELLYNEINKILDLTSISYKRDLFANFFQDGDPLLRIARQYDKDTSVFEIGDYFYKEYLPDFYALYFKGIDILSHRYWKYFRPNSARWKIKPTKEEIRRYGSVIPGYYGYMDKIIGEVVKLKDDSTTIFIVSDHGFGPRPDEGGFNYDFNFVLEKLGLLSYKDSVNKKIDYDKSIIYNSTVAWATTAKLFLNFEKSKTTGILNCQDYYSFIEKIKERLERIEVEGGERLFSNIRVGKKGNSCFNAKKPDLFAKVNNQIFSNLDIIIDGKHYSTTDLIFERALSGSHQIPVQKTDGIIIMSGKNIKRDKKTDNATIYDITPTILYLFGLPLAKDMKGVILQEAIEEDFLNSNPPQYIDTYEDLKPRKKTEEKPIKSLADEEIKKKLRALGYIE